MFLPKKAVVLAIARFPSPSMFNDPPLNDKHHRPTPPQINMNSNAPNTNFEIGKGDTTSFEPVDAGFVGTGPMDSVPSARAQYTQPPPVAGQPSQPPQQPQGYLQRIQNFFSMERLQTSFDVDTEDVKERIIAGLKHANDPDHFRVNVLGQEGKRPDCYGPFWISMTLAFFLSVGAVLFNRCFIQIGLFCL